MRIFLILTVFNFLSIFRSGPALSQAQDYQPNDLIVLFSKTSELKTVQDLKGNIVLAAQVKEVLQDAPKLRYCNAWYTEDFQHLSAEMAAKILDSEIREIFDLFNAAYNGELQTVSCGGDSTGTYRVFGYETDILLLQYKAVNFVNYEEFEPVAIISDIEIREAKSLLEQQDLEQQKKLAELHDRYFDLGRNAASSHLGSMNFSYPNNTEKIKLCTLSVSGDEAVPFLQYPLIEPDQTFTSGLRQAMKKSYKADFDPQDLYQGVFDDLEDFFQQWQADPTICNTFVAYPAKLLEFTNAAIRVEEGFVFELNGLLEVENLQESWAKSYGFDSFADSNFAKGIGVGAEGLKALLDFGVDSPEEYKLVGQAMNAEGYADGEDYSTIIDFLNDRSAGRQDGITALEVKQKREENERLAEVKREEERQRRIKEAQLQRAERIASGNGEFTYYDDGSCKDTDDQTCITEEELIELCRKVDGYYNQPFSTIFNVASFNDPKIRDLETNMGKNAYSDAQTCISKGGDCIFSFRASGTAGGDYINRTYHCKVNSVFGKDGSFGTIGLDYFSCSYR